MNVDPSELTERLRTLDTWKLIRLVRGNLLEPEACEIARRVVLERGIAEAVEPDPRADLMRQERGIHSVNRSILYSESGEELPDHLVAARHGFLGLRFARLDQAISELSQRESLPYPPQIFVSYKWADEAQNRWVATLAAQLFGCGYEVIFDEGGVPSNVDETKPPKVEEFVARLQHCSLFVAVVTTEYLASTLGNRPSWVHDELYMAQHLGLPIVSVVRDEALNDAPGSNFRVEATEPDEAARNITLLLMPSGDSSTSYEGPLLTRGQRVWVTDELSTAMKFGIAGDLQVAANHLQAILREFPFIRRAWELLMDIGTVIDDEKWRWGLLREALQSLSASDLKEPSFLIRRANVHLSIQPRTCLRISIKLLRNPRAKWAHIEAHVLAGRALYALGEPLAARNHLLVADGQTEDSSVPAILAVAYGSMGFIEKAYSELARLRTRNSERADQAQREFDALLRKRASDDPRRLTTMDARFIAPMLSCSSCKSIFPASDESLAICGNCGGSHDCQSARCPYCQEEGVVLTVLLPKSACIHVGCPVCNRGHLSSGMNVNRE